MAIEFQAGAHIVLWDGLRGTVENITRDPATDAPQALVHFTNGQYALVPFSVLQWQPDGTYLLPVGLTDLSEASGVHRRSDEETRIAAEDQARAKSDLTAAAAPVASAPFADVSSLTLGEFDAEDRAQTGSVAATPQKEDATSDVSLSNVLPSHGPAALPGSDAEITLPDARQISQELAAGQQQVLPIVEEQLTVGKREMETGRVRVVKRVEERQETVDQPLFRQEVQVERVPVNRVVSTSEAGGVRTEGDTTIVPVYEEVLVVEKRLMLKEELRVRTVRSEVREPQQVTLRRESVEVERVPGQNGEAI